MLQATHVLITHGSRHPRSQEAAETLRQQISDYLNPDRSTQNAITHQVKHTILEGAAIPLHEQILNCAIQARSQGMDRLQLLPLFLLPGVHVMEDLPQEVAIAQQQLADRDPSFKISTLPYLGLQLQQHPEDLARGWGADGARAKILLSHGSRRPDSLAVSESFAEAIGAVPAYWSIEPSLTQAVEKLFTEGYEEIQVLLYFLFSGGITDAIEASIADLQQTYPNLKLTCESTLDQISEFPQFIAHLLCSSTVHSGMLLPGSFYAEVAR
jgi:sirohydrochlorin cobaltochelatase